MPPKEFSHRHLIESEWRRRQRREKASHIRLGHAVVGCRTIEFQHGEFSSVDSGGRIVAEALCYLKNRRIARRNAAQRFTFDAVSIWPEVYSTLPWNGRINRSRVSIIGWRRSFPSFRGGTSARRSKRVWCEARVERPYAKGSVWAPV